MKMKINTICLLLVLVGASSCSKWIDVKPTDRLSEDVLFADRQGFSKALNGVYSEMANNSVYGRNMSATIIDVLAQYYYLTTSTNSFYDHTMFTYTSATNKVGFENIWKKTYELIVNANVIIEKCGESNPVLPEPFFSLTKGEALAIRAMLHFDMLRLFGPIWSEQAKSNIAIPYNTAGKPQVTPLLTADQVMTNILTDLNASLELLKKSDPIITEGVRNAANPAGDNDLYYRQYRLNYYAVKALLARVSLWKGDKTETLRLCKEILAEAQPAAKPTFPYVTSAAVTNATKPDRVFSTEVMFSLYTINRINLYNDVFAAGLSTQVRLGPNPGNADAARITDMYDDANDYRSKIWENVTSSTGSMLTNQKYKDYLDAPGRYMIPLIRIGEVLLMAAECSPTVEEAKPFLNELRLKRNAFSLNPANDAELTTAIAKEYRRELIGEGQMFFYYKRKALQSIPNNAALVGTKTMVLGNYVVPLPDSETSQRPK